MFLSGMRACRGAVSGGWGVPQCCILTGQPQQGRDGSGKRACMGAVRGVGGPIAVFVSPVFSLNKAEMEMVRGHGGC